MKNQEAQMRSEAAKKQLEVSNPRAGEKKSPVAEQSVPLPEKQHRTCKAKAKGSKTNMGSEVHLRRGRF